MLKQFSIPPSLSSYFLFSSVLLSLRLYYLYVTYSWVASLELPMSIGKFNSLTFDQLKQTVVIENQTHSDIVGVWLYCPDSLEYEQCNQKIITNIAGWNSLSRWCWRSHFSGTWSEAFLHGSIWNHAPDHCKKCWVQAMNSMISVFGTWFSWDHIDHQLCSLQTRVFN